MKVIVLYEQKQYSCEVKVNFNSEDIIFNMRKILGDKENQKYILCDINGNNVEKDYFFYTDQQEMTFILMKIPTFNQEEPLYNDNIREDIINATDNKLSSFDIFQKFPVNHGNLEKKRQSSYEVIANIYGSFNDLPDLQKETSKK